MVVDHPFRHGLSEFRFVQQSIFGKDPLQHDYLLRKPLHPRGKTVDCFMGLSDGGEFSFKL